MASSEMSGHLMSGSVAQIPHTGAMSRFFINPFLFCISHYKSASFCFGFHFHEFLPLIYTIADLKIFTNLPKIKNVHIVTPSWTGDGEPELRSLIGTGFTFQSFLHANFHLSEAVAFAQLKGHCIICALTNSQYFLVQPTFVLELPYSWAHLLT
ncbi:uncharacterized protein LOC131245546 [Magnolia sinica]|uniref:uncharacterized protein LOC131245546 n=1 Tax=Magnolia sinica TaxID=86752 RepID=UPI002658D026|nr:uncharacterized protein LOC131245546 [Magnolia sinica]